MPVITLVRHAQSEANANQNGDMYDPGITELGKEQAAQIEGHYDLVIISTLKRTRETLQHSKVTYGKLMVLDEAREIKIDINSCYLNAEEQRVVENEADMTRRVLRLKETLRELAGSYKDILVVCHYGIIWHMTSTNSQEIIEDTTGEIEPNGTQPQNCQAVQYEL